MRWRPVPAPCGWEGIVVFDGPCSLCTAGMRFLARRDRGARLRFAPIGSEAGRAIALCFGVDPAAPETNIVILGGRAHFKSDAVFAALSILQGWRTLCALRVLPRGLRDWVYDFAARNRYRFTARTCPMPSAGLNARLIKMQEEIA